MINKQEYKDRLEGNQRVILWILMLVAALTALQIASALTTANTYYSFDDDDLIDTKVNDISLYNHYANIIGVDSTGNACKVNECFYYGGDDLGVKLNDTGITSTDWSLSVWVKCTQCDAANRYFLDINTPARIALGCQATGDTLLTYTAAEGFEYGTGDICDGNWKHIVIVTNDLGSNSRWEIWQNGHNTNNLTQDDLPLNGSSICIGNLYTCASTTGSHWELGYIDEMAFYNKKLTPTNIKDLYNSGSGYQPVFLSPSYPVIMVRAYDYYDNSSINTFTVTINNGSTQSTTNGTVWIYTNHNKVWYFNVTYPDYFNVTNMAYINAAINATTYTKYVYPWQSEISFNAYAIISNASIGTAVYSVNGTNITEPAKLRALNDYYATAGAAGYYPLNKTFNVSVFDNLTINIEGLYNAVTLISPRDVINNNTISGANITISNSTYSYTYTATNITNVTLNLLAGKYNLLITAPNRTSYNENITISSGTTVYYAYMYAYNSVWVYAYDIATGLPINTFNVSITNGTTSYSGSGAAGVAYINGVLSGTWDLSVLASGYSVANYVLTMTDNSHQTLNAYLTSSVDDVYFYIKDSSTNAAIVAATVTQKRLINGTLQTVASESSDVAGLVRFYYSDGVTYTISVSRAGYESRTFTIKPILDAYTVRLDPTNTRNESVYIDAVYIILNGYSFTSTGGLSYYSLTFDSNGALEDYFINITSSYNNTYSSGSNANGETINASLNITGASLGDTVTVIYGYKSTVNAGWRYYTAIYYITTFTPGTSTLARAKQYFNGHTIPEKLLIATIISIIAAAVLSFGGLAAGGSGLTAGGLGAFMGFAFSYYLGLISLPLFGFVGFILLMMVGSRLGGDY